MASPHVRAAGATDAGLQRTENQDRFHADAARGVFFVVDGVGGHAAGGRAADIAAAAIRRRLERETGPVDARVREAIVLANNDIFHEAATHPDWHGMACVLTVAVVGPHTATIGHVGDTRLYKLRRGLADKITRDHSPVGEREDAGELDELDAMRHPRRNEVYRDVGSRTHEPHDEQFIDVQTVPFEADAALVLCSDGLSDLVTSTALRDVVDRHCGDPTAVARALVDAANEAGGKDNVTVVYVEGRDFAASRQRLSGAAHTAEPAGRSRAARVAAWTAAAAVIGLAGALHLGALPRPWPWPGLPRATDQPTVAFVRAGGSIAATLEAAQPGTHVVVEPGEYREALQLKDGVSVTSRVPGAAVVRLPASANATDAAVVVQGVGSGTFSGFRIVGDAATPLGVGIFARDAAMSFVDVEVVGASEAAVDLGGARTSLVGVYVHDNPGLGLLIRAGASPRIVASSFERNGDPGRLTAPVVIEMGAQPYLLRNVFHGVSADHFIHLDAPTRQALTRDNWFRSAHGLEAGAPSRPPTRRRVVP